MTENSISFIQSLNALSPHLSASARREVAALDEILTAFRASSFVEIKNQLVKLRQNMRDTPAGFISRIEDFLAGVASEFGDVDTVETLGAEFRKAAAATVKLVAKKFDVALTDKKDAEAFERWLRDGVKPPTVEERLSVLLEPEIRLALELRDQTRRELSSDAIRQILAVAERVKAAHKVAGLAVFMRGIEVEPEGKTAASLLKELRLHLEACAFNRAKATQIRESGDY